MIFPQKDDKSWTEYRALYNFKSSANTDGTCIDVYPTVDDTINGRADRMEETRTFISHLATKIDQKTSTTFDSLSLQAYI